MFNQIGTNLKSSSKRRQLYEYDYTYDTNSYKGRPQVNNFNYNLQNLKTEIICRMRQYY